MPRAGNPPRLHAFHHAQETEEDDEEDRVGEETRVQELSLSLSLSLSPLLFLLFLCVVGVASSDRARRRPFPLPLENAPPCSLPTPPHPSLCPALVAGRRVERGCWGERSSERARAPRVPVLLAQMTTSGLARTRHMAVQCACCLHTRLPSTTTCLSVLTQSFVRPGGHICASA